MLKTGGWMMQNQLMDQSSALDLTWKLWRRQFFHSARELWTDWREIANGEDSASQLVFNHHFEDAPNGSPFDWSIPMEASVEVSRDHGLEIHFLGYENVKLDGIRQSMIVRSGASITFRQSLSRKILRRIRGHFFMSLTLRIWGE